MVDDRPVGDFTLMLKISGVWQTVGILCKDFLSIPEEEIEDPEILNARLERAKEKSNLRNNSPTRPPLLMDSIKIQWSYYNYDLKTTGTTATGTVHLFLEDYRDYVLRRIERWEAMLLEKETGQVILSGYMYLNNSSTPIQTAREGVTLRPVSFTDL